MQIGVSSSATSHPQLLGAVVLLWVKILQKGKLSRKKGEQRASEEEWDMGRGKGRGSFSWLRSGSGSCQMALGPIHDGKHWGQRWKGSSARNRCVI